jgi:hypothetical protein
LLPLFTGGLFAFGILIFFLRHQENDIDNGSHRPLPIHPNEARKDGAPPFSQPSREIADAFAYTTDPDERLKWVRNSKEVATHLSSYSKQALTQQPSKIMPMGIVNSRGLMFARFAARFSSGHPRLICVLQTPDGPKIDWDAYARYGTAHWDDILSGKAKKAQVRAFLEPAYYYSYFYRNDQLWQCYRLTSPDIDTTLYVYARTEKKSARLLARIFPIGSKTLKRITLSISSEGNGYSRRQFTIKKIHAIGWVRAAQDIEEVWTPSIIQKSAIKRVHLKK